MKEFMAYLLQDWEVNDETNTKCRFILIMFRLAQIIRRLPAPLSWLSIFYHAFYNLLVECILGVELPWKAQIGSNLKLFHGIALVINPETSIGANCTLRNSITIGNKRLPNGSYTRGPEIGNNVDIGANVVIIGHILIGDNAVIGAGSVVVKDVPKGAVVVGNPARVIRMLDTASFSMSSENVKPSEKVAVSG